MKRNKKESPVIGVIFFLLVVLVLIYNAGRDSAKWQPEHNAKVQSTITFEITMYYTVVYFDGQISEVWLDSDRYSCDDNFFASDSWDINQNGHNCRYTEYDGKMFQVALDLIGID